MTKPITPSEVAAKKQTGFPDQVLEAFNELIAKNFSGNSATVSQDEVVKLMVKKGLKSYDIYDNNWLDVEGVYEKAGWKVVYDKPGYNEDYGAFFVFKKKAS
jgi:hypothetical protein